MPLKLGAEARIELRWRWEGAPSGRVLDTRDRARTRARLASLCARPDAAAALRRFAHEGAPGQGAPLDDDELLDRIVAAVSAGRLQIAELPAYRLTSFGDEDEEEAVAPIATVAAPVLPPEEICWPCLRAAASARALRAASGDGAPFIADL